MVVFWISPPKKILSTAPTNFVVDYSLSCQICLICVSTHPMNCKTFLAFLDESSNYDLWLETYFSSAHINGDVNRFDRYKLKEIYSPSTLYTRIRLFLLHNEIGAVILKLDSNNTRTRYIYYIEKKRENCLIDFCYFFSSFYRNLSKNDTY